MRKRIWAVLAVLVLAGVGLVACSDKEAGSPGRGITATRPGSTPIGPASDPPLQRAQKAIDANAGYTIKVTANNFVLPQWGGSDGGTVRVAKDGKAVADLRRTGDGQYAITHVNGETFFKRETCQEWTRIPGGGADVLGPFLLNERDAFSNAKNITGGTSGGGTIVLKADLAWLPGATIKLDGTTYLPIEIASDREKNPGSWAVWTFEGWGQAPSVSKPSGQLQERGPGGNPC